MLDLYKFQLEEIQVAGLNVGEDESLEEEKRKLANAEKLVQAVADSYDAIYAQGQTLESLGNAIKRMEDVADLDSGKLRPLLQQMQDAYFQLEDAAYQARDYRDSVEFLPERLDEIEQRLDLLTNLKRKYGSSIEEILEYAANIQQQVEQMENKDERIAELRESLQRIRPKLIELASKLSAARRKAGDRLAADIEQQLQDLHMAHTKFYVELKSRHTASDADLEDVTFTRNGWDNAEFLIAANPGEPLRPLVKIASGGELSRIMLALKSIFSRIDQVPVLVFDEVDTGVSGRAAQAIAEKLSELAEDCQVFAVTHLPQVAGMADQHYAIKKELADGRTYTKVEQLGQDGRVLETARLLGGVEITETTKHHADEMLKLAEQKRRSRARHGSV